MARLPMKPRTGQKTIAALYRSVCEVIDYLPTLSVRGDGKTIKITNSDNGKIISVKSDENKYWDYKGNYQKYIFGDGIKSEYDEEMISGMQGASKEDLPQYVTLNLSGDNQYISAVYPSAYNGTINDPVIIKYVGPAPSGGGGGGSGYIYTGDGDLGSGHIFVDYSYTDPVICSNLRYIDDLLNYPISGDAIGSELHFAQIRDIKDGAGTQVDYHWNSIGDSTQEGGQLIKFIDGVCVNLNISGGNFITTKFHQGVGYGDYTSASIDCNLSGTYNWYPHTSGFIAIVPQTDANQNITGGIISTNLHAGSGIAIDPQTGEITCTVDPGGGSGTVIASGIGYPDHSKLFPDAYSAVSGIGISWLIPVSAGVEYRFYTDATGGTDSEDNVIQLVYGKFAPSVGETGMTSSLTNGNDFVPDSNGWVRISVFDDGRNEGKCLRFYVNDEDGQYATPLYRFHGFTNYTAGAGIAINSGIIRNMIQPGQGLTSTALYDGNTSPYDPNRPITGIALDLSSNFYGDLTIINNRGVNKVLSSSNHGNLVWATNVTPTNEFFAPDFAKLQVQNDVGESALGLGTTFLVPVASGKNVKYSADGGTIVAVWAPVEGSSKSAHEVTTTNWTTTDDGYVRISVIDDGTLSAGCLRLYVDNKDVPLHKFAKFNYSSGAIYEAGRYMQIQTTSTRINPQTEQEEPYTLENPIINNMLTGGRFITIQEEENNVELEYPRINCDLSEGTNIQITTGGVINCTLTGTSQLTNDAGYITTVDIPPSTTYIGTSGIAISTILDANDRPTTSANIYISASFYNTLTNPTNNTILSCNGGNLCWVQNTGGSTPTPTPGGGNVVYITAEGEYDLQGNTHYYVLLDPVLSTDQNVSPDQQEWYKIYKYMWYDKNTGENQGQTILTTTVRYEDGYYYYGAYKTPGDPDSWEEYGQGGVFGAKLNFPVPQATTHISITAFRNSNCIVCAPYGGCIWDWSDPSRYPLSGTSGMWFGEFLQRMNKDFIFDPSTQRWYQVDS